MPNGTYSRTELREAVRIKHKPTFLYNYLQLVMEVNMIALTIHD
ncbi:Fic family protein [Flavobacterium sp. TMP13]